MMMQKNHISLILILIIISALSAQNRNLIDQQNITSADSIVFMQIKTDSIFNSRQIISLLLIDKSLNSEYRLKFAYSPSDLIKTSTFAKNNKALAAVNGGFFNMDSGGGVTYFELNDTVITRTRNPDLKWGIEDSIMNGAIVVGNDSEITIQPVHSEQFYEFSHQESAVLVTGPLLLLNSEEIKLPLMKFSSSRHPRTCLCLNQDAAVLITIDGRNQAAAGMSLIEVQQFLLSIGCIDAVNLDGGGSTTMWIQDQGIVNYPSDKSGERPVANALIILNVNNQ